MAATPDDENGRRASRGVWKEPRMSLKTKEDGKSNVPFSEESTLFRGLRREKVALRAASHQPSATFQGRFEIVDVVDVMLQDGGWAEQRLRGPSGWQL